MFNEQVMAGEVTAQDRTLYPPPSPTKSSHPATSKRDMTWSFLVKVVEIAWHRKRKLTCRDIASKAMESALAFYKGLKVYPAPGELMKIYDSTVPKVRRGSH